MPSVSARYVAYLRHAPGRQGVMSIDAQREKAVRFAINGKAKIVREFIETDFGSDGAGPQLFAAIAHCKVAGAELLLAQIGRLRSNLPFMKALSSSGVEFMALDLPEASHLYVDHMILQELQRRKVRSRAVREGLARAKARGVMLGGNRGNKEALRLGPAASAIVRNRLAKARAISILKEITLLREKGASSLRQLAAGLNEHGIKAPRGGSWSAAQVRAAMLTAESID